MIKSYDNCANRVISWNEFEVIARNCPHAGPFENRRMADKKWDFDVQVRQNANHKLPGYGAGIGLHLYGRGYGTHE